jgi:hypothetical protein
MLDFHMMPMAFSFSTYARMIFATPGIIVAFAAAGEPPPPPYFSSSPSFRRH